MKNLQVALKNFFAAFLKLLTRVVIAMLLKLATVVGVKSIVFIIVSFFVIIIFFFLFSDRFLIFNFLSLIFNFFRLSLLFLMQR